MEVLIGVLIGAIVASIIIVGFFFKKVSFLDTDDTSFSALLVQAIDNSKVDLENIFNFMDVDCISNVYLDEASCSIEGDVVKFVFSVEIQEGENKKYAVLYSRLLKDFVKWGFVCGEETL